MDAAVAVLREFGPTVGGVLLVILALVVAVRILATRLERAYDARIEAITKGHEQTVKALSDGHQREIEAIQEHSRKGWAMADAFRQQAERLADRYGDATSITRDMVDEVFKERGRGRSGSR